MRGLVRILIMFGPMIFRQIQKFQRSRSRQVAAPQQRQNRRPANQRQQEQQQRQQEHQQRPQNQKQQPIEEEYYENDIPAEGEFVEPINK